MSVAIATPIAVAAAIRRRHGVAWGQHAELRRGIIPTWPTSAVREDRSPEAAVVRARPSAEPARRLRSYRRHLKKGLIMGTFVESVAASTDNRKRMLLLSILSFIVLL
jgi:hypothetical protein